MNVAKVGFAGRPAAFVLAAMVSFLACSCGEAPYPAEDAQWAVPPVRIDLSPYGAVGSALEFATDGQTICAWGWPPGKNGLVEKDPGDIAVFDLQGRLVREAVGLDGALRDGYADQFPGISWRDRLAGFVRPAEGWGFSPDGCLGFRLVKSNPSPGITTAAYELWRLGPKAERLWAVPAEASVMRLETAGFFERDGKPYVLLAFSGEEACVLSQKDGSVVERFTYGHIETDEEQRAAWETFGRGLSEGDPSLRFSAFPIAFDPARRLVACGAFYGRRVRVLSADPPHETVFEAHTGENPWEPRGGVWMVQNVEFAAGGRYLIAESHFGGRGTSHVMGPTEIFETGSWKKVWSENSLGVGSVTLSHDGRRLALVRGKVLEIGPFVPTEQSAP